MTTQTDEFERFIISHWQGEPDRWFASLAKAGWLGIDWPVRFGGTGWSRPQQIEFVSIMARHCCPLMPDSISVIAPLVIYHGSAEQQETLLSGILEDPARFVFQINEPVKPGCLLDTETSTLSFIDDDLRLTTLGDEGAALRILAASFSPVLLIHERLTALEHILKLQAHWNDAASVEVSQLQVTTDALMALYLRNTPRTDSHIGLVANRERLDLHACLFRLLGYYALLNPDPALTGNEPLPFAPQRQYLQALSRQLLRDEVSGFDAEAVRLQGTAP